MKSNNLKNLAILISIGVINFVVAGLSGFYAIMFATPPLIDLTQPDRIVSNYEKSNAAFTVSWKCILIAFVAVVILAIVNSSLLGELTISKITKQKWLIGLAIFPIFLCSLVMLIGVSAIYR